jgi:hypothetical protein
MDVKTCKNFDLRCCTRSTKRYIARIGALNSSFAFYFVTECFTLRKFNRFENMSSGSIHRVQMECNDGFIGFFIDNEYVCDPRYTFSNYEQAQFAFDCWETSFKTTETSKFFTVDFTLVTHMCYLRWHENGTMCIFQSALHSIFERTVHNLEYHGSDFKTYISMILPWFDRKDRMIFENYLIMFHSSLADFHSFEFHSRLVTLFSLIHPYL